MLDINEDAASLGFATSLAHKAFNQLVPEGVYGYAKFYAAIRRGKDEEDPWGDNPAYSVPASIVDSLSPEQLGRFIVAADTASQLVQHPSDQIHEIENLLTVEVDDDEEGIVHLKNMALPKLGALVTAFLH